MKRAIKAAALMMLAPLLIGAGNPATETEHIVKEGETLGGIANRAGVDKTIIVIANGLSEPYNVRVGQKLFIPRQRTHTVKSGEVLSRIAERYDVPLSNLAVANGVEKPYNVRVGQKLIIPAIFKMPAPSAQAPKAPYFRRPHDGKILFGFTKRPDGGGHDGLDIAINKGDMIRASSGGTVEFAGTESKRFGRMVIINHGQGYKSVYGHLARVTVTKGEYVKSGERIGIGGDAGVATRPELHFEIQKNGKDIDPAPLMPSR